MALASYRNLTIHQERLRTRKRCWRVSAEGATCLIHARPALNPNSVFDAPFTTSHARLNTSTAVTNSKRSMVPDVCVFLQDTRLHNVVCSTVNCDIVRELGELGAGVRRMFAPLFEMIDEHWHLPAFCCYCGAFHRLMQRPTIDARLTRYDTVSLQVSDILLTNCDDVMSRRLSPRPCRHSRFSTTVVEARHSIMQPSLCCNIRIPTWHVRPRAAIATQYNYW